MNNITGALYVTRLTPDFFTTSLAKSALPGTLPVSWTKKKVYLMRYEQVYLAIKRN